ncbi:hypothetical protein HUO13_12100 [Saccharopolyspora erythraea]|uniref:Gp19/Gp15/Gp42 family protein n=1 Tax=Saccharopolyspora erythraea TaxID=1836 RepID=UPI001BACC0A7|nr:Gp19/Gp15/Gp42 family protein [Saccharopolyspora erythraea]QUH01455.1 hypothetical protein HUO13_12100 [Saccharopolyspora erythraea]
MATATPQDVESRLGRPFEDGEAERAATLLSDVELLIQSRLSDLTSVDPGLLVMVEATAVARVLRNPDGIREQNAESFGYTLDTRVASGYLTVLDTEWRLLGVRRGYGSIPMKFRTVTDAPCTW